MHTIGRMATLAGVSPDTLRYYEKERLIAPVSRTAAGYRLYGDEALRRIRFIRSAQHCGFTLTDIRELLELKRADAACCEDVRSLAVRKKLHIERKLKALRQDAVRRMHAPLAEQHRWYASVLHGHYGYFGVPHNIRALNAFHQETRRIWFRSLRRRSQKARRLTWDRFKALLERFPLPQPRITHPWAAQTA